MAAFDCKPEGISARWKKWVRRLEESIFAADKITDPLQKKGKLLVYGGEALHDIWDDISKDIVEGQEYEELKDKLTTYFEQIETSVLTDNICNERFSKQFKNPHPLGQGGYGTVYKVEHIVDQQLYAVKEVHFRECSEKEVARVLQEVKHLAKLSDRLPPHIVRYYSAWLESDPNPPPPNTPDSSISGSQSASKECTKCQSGNLCKPFLLYIQMELCDGTLDDWLKDRNQRLQINDDVYSVVNVAENELIMEQLLQALAFIHAMDIIHRDVKPENIFMTRALDNSYRVKFGDFGLTRDTSIPELDLIDSTDLNSHSDCCHNETNQADTKPVYTKGIGTTYYAAPEQLDTESEENYDHKADMYSLGVVLYELYQPFTSPSDRVRLIAKLRGQKEEDVAKFKKDLPHVAPLILKLLSEPAARPSASELLERKEQQRIQHDRKLKDEVRSLAAEIEGLQVKDAEKDKKAELLKKHVREMVLEFGLSRVSQP